LFYLDERYQDALKESATALSIEPGFVDASVLQVQSLLKLRRFDDVIRACDSAIAQGKKSALLYQVRALAHAAEHDYPGAIRDYGEALELRPDDARLLTERGWAYLVFDSPRLALADFEAAIKLEPGDGDAYSGRGTARAVRGDHAGAVADAREAIRRAGTGPRVIYNAARIYAVAASAVSQELGENGRQARQLAGRYQDTALQLIRQAFEREAPEKRAAFWRETVQLDPALKAIRRRIKFEDLIVTNK
jgi:Flp pilus assembly protein TadD